MQPNLPQSHRQSLRWWDGTPHDRRFFDDVNPDELQQHVEIGRLHAEVAVIGDRVISELADKQAELAQLIAVCQDRANPQTWSTGFLSLALAASKQTQNPDALQAVRNSSVHD